MNKERIREIADLIRREPEKFRMDTWDCGTVACVGGWATKKFPHSGGWDGDANAAEALGIAHGNIEELFYARSLIILDPDDGYDEIKGYERDLFNDKPRVASALEWMCDNDTINWAEAFAACPATESAL